MASEIDTDDRRVIETGLPTKDKVLLTPGPLTTSLAVKQAMLHDVGSRDTHFIEVNKRVCDQLLKFADAEATHVCIPLQGSGTFAVEAMIANLVPPAGKLLNLVNGAYGKRISKIAGYLNRNIVIQEFAENKPVDPETLDTILAADKSITHVSVVYCETTSGILNPLDAIARITAQHQRALLIDAMSAFGALPLSAETICFQGLAASSNKCLQGVPGIGFCIVDRRALEQSQGNAHSLSLDLYDQWQCMRNNGQWRFTPPTHCLLALNQALSELEQEGSVTGRGQRYRDNCTLLIKGMRELGFKTLLPDALQAPIIVTFMMPSHPEFDFQVFYDRLSDSGYVIYPGKLTHAATFRIGCIGELGADDIRQALSCIKSTLHEMGVDNCAP